MHELLYDVIEAICDSVDHVPTILALSLVSRALRVVAVKRLLRMGTVSLNDSRTTKAFHQFLFADPGHRLPFFRALDLGFPPVSEPNHEAATEKILDILQRSTSIQLLTISRPGPPSEHPIDPRVLEAVAHLSTLRKLWLLNVLEGEEMIVKSTRSVSTLTFLRLTLAFLGWDVHVLGFDAFLGHLAPKLQHLEATYPVISLSSGGLQYPAIHTLRITINPEFLHTGPLVHKFPALKTLHIDLPFPPRDGLSGLRQIRASNQKTQSQEGSWSELDRVFGEPTVVFALGLTCPVRHLMLEERGEVDTDVTTAGILRDNPPSRLKLFIPLGHNDWSMEGFFPEGPVPRLTHLVLILLYNHFDGEHTDNPPAGPDGDFVHDFCWGDLLAQIKSSFRGLQLTHLRLFVQYSIVPTLHGGSHFYSKDFVQDLIDLDHLSTAAELATIMPSLKNIFLTAGGEYRFWHASGGERMATRGRWHSTSAWAIHEDSGEASPRRLERLEDGAMERMIVEEDLFLSEKDRDILQLDRQYTAEETAPWHPS